MSRTVDEKVHQKKRQHILKAARQILLKKGYSNTSMLDVASAAGISRGGLYLYFSSVEEIMQTILIEKDQHPFDPIRAAIIDKQDFLQVLDQYLTIQKQRLLNISKSLLMSGYEYYAFEKSASSQEFLTKSLADTRRTVLGLLMLGVDQEKIHDQQIEDLADYCILTIEGLSLFCYLHQADEKYINRQLALLKKTIMNNKRN